MSVLDRKRGGDSGLRLEEGGIFQWAFQREQNGQSLRGTEGMTTPFWVWLLACWGICSSGGKLGTQRRLPSGNSICSFVSKPEGVRQVGV